MHLLDPLGNDYASLSEIFEKIYKKNAIALLGAGASVTNKQYMSKQLIDLYEAKISKSFETNDIIQFVDFLQETPGLRRVDFDTFVIDQLKKLTPNEGHKTLVTIPWKQIITTNYDTLVEEASEAAQREHETHYKLRVVRDKQQMNSTQSDGEITYIKLNGCKTDLSRYPLVFSTEDFKNQGSFYKKVISSYHQFSNELLFISFGYSFSDIFSDKLLDKVANSDAREKRTLYCVDPYINADRLNYLSSRQICVVKLSFEDFFVAYKKWFESNSKSYLKTLQKFTNPEGSTIQIGINSRLYISNNIVQLKDDYRATNRVKKYDFYFGEEPNYQVIIDKYDVVKSKQQEEVLTAIEEAFNEFTKTTIPKLLLISGDFGTGKTTFTLRAINEYLRRYNTTLAFEITNPSDIKKGYIAKLIEESTATQFIFYCDNIEIDSIFKSFLELRVEIASEQNADIKVMFISSIRENILQKHLNHTKLSIANHATLTFDPAYSDSELELLVENLKEVGLLGYRDVSEKTAIIYDIKKKYKGDSFVTLYKLIEGGAHYRLLEKAYDELSTDLKMAFKITALIHRFNILCPVSVVKNSIKNMSWEDFTGTIVKGDGKGILFQVTKNSVKNEPDLYFKTKHPIIAEALIKQFVKNNEKNTLYKTIFESLSYSEFNASFIIDLLKSIRSSDSSITKGQIEHYFEIARKEFEISPHFMLGYVTNLEKGTNSIQVLKKCLQDITLLEATLDRRNHRLIHRKGSICFKIGKILFYDEKSSSEVLEYLADAEEWFDIKKLIDPLSAYSYLDYFNLLVWKLKNSKKLKLNNEQKLQAYYQLTTLFDEASRTLYGNTEVINALFEDYKSVIGVKEENGSYEEFLLEQYQDPHLRPAAAILLFYYYEYIEDSEKCHQLFEELKSYTDSKDVVYFLFKQYGRSLHLVNNRMRFFELVAKNDFLKTESHLRYCYFNAICEFYNLRWTDGWNELNELKSERFYTISPDFFLYWKNENGEEEIFEAQVIRDKKLKKVKILSPFFKTFSLIKGDYKEYAVNQEVEVKLKFFLDGVKAQIVSQNG